MILFLVFLVVGGVGLAIVSFITPSSNSSWQKELGHSQEIIAIALRQLGSQFCALEGEFKQTRQMYLDMRTELQQLKEREIALIDQLLQQRKWDDVQKQVDDLALENAQLKEQVITIQNVELENRRLTEKIETLVSAAHRLQQEKAESESQIKELQKKEKTLSKQVKDAKAELKEANAQLAEIKRSEAAFREKLFIQKVADVDVEAELEKLREENAELRDELWYERDN